jgi:hypothetical protein
MKFSIASAGLMALLPHIAAADMRCTGGVVRAEFNPAISAQFNKIVSSVQVAASGCTSIDSGKEGSAMHLSFRGHGDGGCFPTFGLFDGRFGEVSIIYGNGNDEGRETKVEGTFSISTLKGISIDALVNNGPEAGKTLNLSGTFPGDFPVVPDGCLSTGVSGVVGIIDSLAIAAP